MPVARPESSPPIPMSAPTKIVFELFGPMGPMVKDPEPGSPGPPASWAVPTVKVMRLSVRARPVAEPTAPSRMLTLLVQSPATLAAQLMVTVARAVPLVERVAVPEIVVTAPDVGSTRKTVSPLAAEVIVPRSAFCVTWTV
jgi:hypothetical protein